MRKMQIRQNVRYASLDYFRLLAAALVVAIHTSPLLAFSADADFFLTRVLARIAVPFFFMVTGQFVVSSFSEDPARVLRYVEKIALLYGVSMLLYLPLGVYAGHYEKANAADVLRMLVFDGTFYHLWYFPACITGVLLVFFGGKFLKRRQLLVLAAVLYGIGMFGDSYYGLIEHVPVVGDIYEAGFCVFSYTRNGIFMAPVFLLLGEEAAKRRLQDRRVLWAGLFVSFLAMSEEAFLLRHFEVQRHDSMYLFLLPTMFFLYEILLSGAKQEGMAGKGGPLPRHAADGKGGSLPRLGKGGFLLRHAVTVSTWIYILHPAMIVAVRGVAKVAKMDLLAKNSLAHYLAVLACSAVAAFALSLCLDVLKRMVKGQDGHAQGRFSHERLPSGQKADGRQDGHAQGKFSRKRLSGGQKADGRQDGRVEGRFCHGRAWLELDRGALRQNIDALRRKLPESCRLMPAVKADAYGHGAVFVAKELQKAGVDAFCVACVQEGVRLRKAGIQGVILILGYTHPLQFPLLCAYRLTQTVVDYGYAMQLNAYGKTVHVHIGIDTGMHRLGVRCEHPEQVMQIYGMEHLAVDGLYTHLCTSDTEDIRGRRYTSMQAEAFYNLIGQLEKRGYPCPKIHMQASYGVFNYPELAGDYARVGIALYGVLSTKEDTQRWQGDLTPVLSLKARVATVKALRQGESAGYGIQFTAKHDMAIATLTIGYADGLPRSLSDGVGSVLVRGRRAPVIGPICMDQTIVDVSGIEDVQAGDVAVLIGHSGDLEISACDIAKQAGTIANEVLSRMGARLERVFV